MNTERPYEIIGDVVPVSNLNELKEKVDKDEKDTREEDGPVTDM